MEKKLSYKCLAPHIQNLRGSGCYQLSKDQPKQYRILHTFYMRFVLSFILLYTVQQIMKVYQERDDIDRVMDTLFLLLTNSDSIYKQLVLWLKADQIEELLDVMKGPIFNQDEQKHEKLLNQTIRQGLIILRGFNYVALATCLLWSLYPVILHVQGKEVQFAIWLPFDPNTNPQFYFVVVYVWIQTSWLAFNNTTMDGFIAFFLAQCKTQLSIIKLDLENLVNKSKEDAKLTSTDYSTVLRRRFVNILLHYKETVGYGQKVQDIFSGAILYQFMVGGWILCTTAYRTVNINPTSVEFISMIMYMNCIVTELFLYCFYGNEVNLESDKLVESAYTMDWLELPLKYRRDLIIFMEGVKRPITPMAGNIIPLANATFVSIMRSSYSFYAFLKNSN